MSDLTVFERAQRWARNIHSGNPTRSGDFLKSYAEAILRADEENQALMLSATAALMVKYPKYDIPERH